MLFARLPGELPTIHPTVETTGAYLPDSWLNKNPRPPCIISLIYPAAGSIASVFSFWWLMQEVREEYVSF